MRAGNWWTPASAAWFLLTRGIVLVALEITLVRWGWYFNVDYRQTRLQILWAIGVSMMMLAPWVFLPPRLVGAIGLAITLLHNLIGTATPFGLPSWLWGPLYERGRELAIVPGFVVTINFPVLPLFGVMAIGYALGEVFRWPETDRRRALLIGGGACIGLFVLLRAANLYGDPLRWVTGEDATRSLMSFMALTKHPLSLLMTLSTLGVGLIWLGIVRAERPMWRPLIVIGRAPMFFYLIHVPIIHALAFAYSLVVFGGADWLLTSPFDRGPNDLVAAGWGFGLPGVYAWWMVVMLLTYPLCQWFADVKARSRSAWFSYF
mgnify:FL=1